MSEKEEVSRRSLLRSATVAGAAVAATITPPAMAPQSAQAQTPAAPVVANAATASSGYTFLGPVDAAFFEAVVDHMVPADELTPGGVDLGIAVFIDRALAGSWGKGDRLYAQGPWKLGTPNQGYQLPLTPAELFRAGVEQTNIYCAKTFGGKPLKKSQSAVQTNRSTSVVGSSLLNGWALLGEMVLMKIGSHQRRVCESLVCMQIRRGSAQPWRSISTTAGQCPR